MDKGACHAFVAQLALPLGDLHEVTDLEVVENLHLERAILCELDND